MASNVDIEKAGTDYDYAFDIIAFRFGARKGDTPNRLVTAANLA